MPTARVPCGSLMDPHFFAALMDAARRTRHDDSSLLSTLADRCWPGGLDRTEPVALEWVRSWGPRRAMLALDCACDSGRCGTCN